MRMDRDAPRVSVIVATYNWSSVLRYALLSVQAQTFTDYEVLVMGDCCTDDSAEVVASLNDSRFRWENLPINHGHQSAPNNRGLSLARGQWIAYLGHDDLWMRNHLELLVRKVEEAGADVAFSLAMAIGAPGCDGRALFGLFENGGFQRGCEVPPSALIHRRSLAEQCETWPDYRATTGSPESAVLAQFFEREAEFAFIPEITVFKFPSSWRPLSYVKRSSQEQAQFFERMQHQPDFLQRELVEFAMTTQLLKPHTRMPAAPAEDDFKPGAVVAAFRRNRGLTKEAPEEGPARHVPTPALAKMIASLTNDEMARRQRSRFAIFEILYGQEGHYSLAASTRTLIPIGRWARVRVPLEHRSVGAPLRIDPCERPGLIELAWIGLRRDDRLEWSARGCQLGTLTFGGDAYRIGLRRVLTIRSRGCDPVLYLPANVPAEPPAVFGCWMRISAVTDV
jgi:hypothetical protein